MKTLVLDLVYLAKTYGMDGRVQFRLIEDPDTFRKVKLEMAELPADVAADLAAIQAIGTEQPFHEREFDPYAPDYSGTYWTDMADRAYEEMFE